MLTGSSAQQAAVAPDTPGRGAPECLLSKAMKVNRSHLEKHHSVSALREGVSGPLTVWR